MNEKNQGGEIKRLILEDADALERTAEEADDNQWQDWGATMRQAAERIRALSALSPSEQPEPVADLWQELCERDDRTSPEEYPEMCLITFEEFSDFIQRGSGTFAGHLVTPKNGGRPTFYQAGEKVTLAASASVIPLYAQPSKQTGGVGRLTVEEGRRVQAALYMVGNPSAWDGYDEGASETIRDLCAMIAALSTKEVG